jgi:leucyl aminopeptidase
MKIKFQNKVKSSNGMLVIPVFKEGIKKLPKEYPEDVLTFIRKRIKDDDFKGSIKENFLGYLNIKTLPEKLLVIGAGEEGKFDREAARKFGAKVGKAARSSKAEELTIFFPELFQKHAEEVFEGMLLTQYKYDEYKTEKDKKKKKYELKLINVVATKRTKEIARAFDKAKLVALAVSYTKKLVNSPSNFVDTDYMALKAREIAKDNKYKIASFGDKELKKMGWGGLLAVNQGSKKEARAIVLEYQGSKVRKEKPIVIVGKGVLFDTGGYNIKPTNHIETMHQDMAGAATVLGVFTVLKKLGIKRNVVGIVSCAENLISEKAYKPSDIITMFSGDTVEITNTDAEGRLVLADAVTYATKLNPDSILTIATLTGAVAVALGERYAGLFSNDNDLRGELQGAGDYTDDLGWALPIHDDHRKRTESKIADLKNCDLKRTVGASTAAAFLEKFVDKNKWCHIDIGGTAFTEDPKEYEQKGATAHGLRMLLRFLEARG